MQPRLLAITVCLLSAALWGQVSTTPSTQSPPGANAAASGGTSTAAVLPELDQLQSIASQAALAIGHMRIEKWKADGQSKQQAQANADSIQRNLTSALPGMIDAVRANPQDVAAEFKLYRNVNALYDVFSSLTESAGAFGPKSDYEALAQQLATIDAVRRRLGDAVEQLTTATQTEVNQLRGQVRAAQQAAAAAPPKKVVVDETEKPKKTVKKKKPANSTAASDKTTSTPSKQ